MSAFTNNQLKDFQSATVDYVFNRFTDENISCNRFLVADEVGLGKTLIARGIIQKFYDHYARVGKKGLNVIYICSNQSIASQNINRLNVERNKDVSQAAINRINDLAITSVEDHGDSFLKLTALSPNTSFNISRGGGIKQERAILFHIITQHPDFKPFREKLKRIFQLDVSDVNWNWIVGKDCWIVEKLRPGIVSKFIAILSKDDECHREMLEHCSERYNSNELYSYRRTIGKLRKLLASVCVAYLKPDIIILDEFQRFKYLINEDEDNEVHLITESLFNDPEIKMLLLSATPYKMYTMQSEEQEGENHFDEFRFIVDFLLNDKNKQKEFEDAWDDYSKSLLHLRENKWEYIKGKKRIVEAILHGVIARTERITVSDDRNTMLRPSKSDVLWVTPSDVLTFIAADNVAVKLKDVQSPIEYCKSSPFPFSFMEGYQLQRLTQKEISAGNTELLKVLRQSTTSFLPMEVMNNYGELPKSNAKLSYLMDEMVTNGGVDLLWIPPALPYYIFQGAFKTQETFSKTLVFSSWIMVPKMIAALTSYECERNTIGDKVAIQNAEDRSERKYFQTGSERHPKARLRFRIENGNFSTLSNYALLYPSITLGELWEPDITMETLDSQITKLEQKIGNLISTINISSYVTDTAKVDDDRWALIYMVLLDRKKKRDAIVTLIEEERNYDWDWFNRDEELSIANEYYEKVFRGVLFAEYPKDVSASMLALGASHVDPLKAVLSTLKLGHPPKDITTQLALLSIASPAVCSFRFLSSLAERQESFFKCFFGGFQIADSFRKFFNVSENIAVVDKFRKFDSYWKNVLSYSAAGNFQSMIDEFGSALIDHNGLWDYSEDNKLQRIISLLSENIGLRTVSVAGHTYQSFTKEERAKHFRCHYGVALNHSIDNEKDVMRSDNVRNSFNSPFRPFILATTSVGQEGLDFHLYCRKLLHWNLPANPVDFEQREGRINRFKNLAIRQNLAVKYRQYLDKIEPAKVWSNLYELAIQKEKGNKSDMVPYWHVEPQNIFIERQAPVIPYSKEVKKLKNLLKTISVYRIALGQPRQEDLINHLMDHFTDKEIEKVHKELLINLSPFRRHTK